MAISIIEEPQIPSKFKCLSCDELHGDPDDAATCCSHVEEVVQCPLCLKVHTGFEAHYEALNCCDFDPDQPIPATKYELEAAGQMTLTLERVGA